MTPLGRRRSLAVATVMSVAATLVASVGAAPVVGGSPRQPLTNGTTRAQVVADASAIVPGAVNRTSMSLSATYQVALTLRYDAATMSVDSTMSVTNTSGASIDRLELNSVAARLGGMRISTATVDGRAVTPRIDDQTVFVPLGGVLPAGESARVRLVFDARLRTTTTGSNWLFTRANGILSAYRWLPWISRERSFDRPSFGFPFVTPVSPRVEVTISTDRTLKIATGGTRTYNSALTQRFVATNVRDFNIAASPFYKVLTGTSGDTTIQVFYRSGAASSVLNAAKSALTRFEPLLGQYPYRVLRFAQSPSATYGSASPGLIWLPSSLSTSNIPYLVRHETAHQWFYGMVGNDLAQQPFAHEATSEFMSRYTLGLLRASRCAKGRLDLSIYGYSSSCYYEIVYVQGASFLNGIRSRMGTSAFFRGVRAYLAEHRFRFGGTKVLLDTLDRYTSLDLVPAYRSRFPRYY